jgi:hypothetical protein
MKLTKTLTQLAKLNDKLARREIEKQRELTRKLAREGRQFFLAEFAGSKR